MMSWNTPWWIKPETEEDSLERDEAQNEPDKSPLGEQVLPKNFNLSKTQQKLLKNKKHFRY